MAIVEETTAPAISIVLPVYNQADHIGAIIDGYEEALQRLNHTHELLVVPNGCRDESVAICQRAAEQHPSVKCIVSEKGGWGHAVRVGLAAARGEWVCYTNSARTTTHDLILVLTYATVFPDVVVKANRKIRDNIRRRAGSLLYNLECRALFDLSVWDINGTPKVFPRRYQKLLDLVEDNDLIDLEFNAICRQEEYPVLEVPILSTARHSGKSTTNLGSAFRMYLGAYRLWQQRTQTSSIPNQTPDNENTRESQ